MILLDKVISIYAWVLGNHPWKNREILGKTWTADGAAQG
jgi:hypothetical protein